MFYFSLFPKLYLFLLGKNLKNSLDIFFYNNPFSYSKIEKIIEKPLLEKLIKLNIVSRKREKYKFNYSFIPFKEKIFVRDSYNNYSKWFDPVKLKDKVWMGADSIIFLKFLEKYLNKKKLNKVLELGSGSGIVINSIANNFKNCEAVDINKRAIQLTQINSYINKIKNVKCYKSNFFKKIKGNFDIIISNPWFVNLKKGGLEQVPKIVKHLDKKLKKNGKCLMILNSYFKDEKDTALIYFKNFLKEKKYDVSLFTNGYNLELERLKDFRKHNIEYCISYNVIIDKNGSGILKRYEASYFRRLRDFTFIKLMKIL